jgi:hypothetical protein
MRLAKAESRGGGVENTRRDVFIALPSTRFTSDTGSSINTYPGLQMCVVVDLAKDPITTTFINLTAQNTLYVCVYGRVIGKLAEVGAADL